MKENMDGWPRQPERMNMPSDSQPPSDPALASVSGYAAETVETLRACRDHWKVSWENERENVIRLRKIINVVHGPRCDCDDCRLVKQHND